MKIELEHIAPYLPYGLNCKTETALHFPNGSYMKNSNYTLTIGNLSDIIDNYSIGVIKPILRPLSDLTEEIVVNGDDFIPKNKMTRLTRQAIEHNGFDDWRWFSYMDIEKLISWHFDIFGLIDKGLAINKNEL